MNHSRNIKEMLSIPAGSRWSPFPGSGSCYCWIKVWSNCVFSLNLVGQTEMWRPAATPASQTPSCSLALSCGLKVLKVLLRIWVYPPGPPSKVPKRWDLPWCCRLTCRSQRFDGTIYIYIHRRFHLASSAAHQLCFIIDNCPVFIFRICKRNNSYLSVICLILCSGSVFREVTQSF